MSAPRLEDLRLHELIGLPFVDSGRDPSVGLDCWGVVMEVHRRMGNPVQDLAAPCSCMDAQAQWESAQRAIGFRMWYPIERDQLQLGDVIAMALDERLPNVVAHAAVYIGDGQFLHSFPKHNCCVGRLDDHWYKNKVRGFYRWDR